jgi:hypothetical protein
MSIPIIGKNKEKAKKPISEIEFRNKILFVAGRMGCEMEIVQIFNKYDKLLRGCANDKERSHISKLGIMEIDNIFSVVGGLAVLFGKDAAGIKIGSDFAIERGKNA